MTSVQSEMNNLLLGSVGKLDLASSDLSSACLHPAVSAIKQTSPASPSLSGEKTLALRPTTEFSDRLLGGIILERQSMKRLILVLGGLDDIDPIFISQLQQVDQHIPDLLPELFNLLGR